MILAFACFRDFKLYQMDVKSAFLNGFINEEVYVKQPLDFENHAFPNHVFKLSKALYGLKQTPRAWYERLRKFLIENNFLEERLTQHFLLKLKMMIYLLCKYMWMTLYLVLLMKLCVRNLLSVFKVSLRWAWWGS